MSDNQTNPDSEGTNAQPPSAGHSPESGAEVGSQSQHQPAGQPAEPSAPSPSSPYQAQPGYDPSAPWMRPATDPAPTEPAPTGGPTTGPAPGGPAPGGPARGGAAPGGPAPGGPAPGGAAPGAAPTSYGQQTPYGPGATPYGQAGPPYGQGATYSQSQSSSYDPYAGGGTPYAAPSSTSPYGSSTPTGPGSTPTYAGQVWTVPPIGPPPTTTDPYGNQPNRPGHWRRGVVAVAAGAVLALGAGAVGGFVGYALHPDNGGSPVQTNAQGNPKNAAPAMDRSSLAGIAKGMQPLVVSVKNQIGEGSGVVISADGYIVTNNHVVTGSTGSSVQVTFNSGKVLPAKIVGTDPKTDLAVIKVDTTGLSFATWDDSDAVQVGDTVLAIGSPLGLQGSVTAGIVSALHRTITVGGDAQSQFQAPAASTTIGDAIQTDAPINPGNSGGALVDTNGKVIGINSAIATSGSTGNIGVGFAISSNKAKSVAEQLIKGGKVSHPYLGVSIGDAQNGGAQIQTVQPGSPAANAGVQEGDVITKVGDRSISTGEDLVGAVQSSSPGVKMTLTVVRNGSESTVTATVGDQP